MSIQQKAILYLALVALFRAMDPLWLCAEAPPTWSDEFDGSGPPNPATWTFEQGFVRNKELQWYTNNATKEEGVLVIEARREQVLNPNFTTTGDTDWRKNREYADYTSASIVSAGKYSFQYGRMQVRARIPCFTGSWPAIWTMGNGGEWPSSGECDVMEYYLVGGVPGILANLSRGTTTRWSAAWDGASRPVSQLTAVDSSWKTAYHIWTMQWDQDNVRLYVDNILMNTIPQSWIVNPVTTWGPQYPFKQPHYILLNLAIGGAGGDPSGTTFPLHYEVDYVRVWEGATNNVAPTGIALSTNRVGENLPAGTVVGNLSATDADPGEVISYSLVTGTGSTNNSQFQIAFLSGETKTSVLKTAAVLSYADGAARSVRVRATDIVGATYDKVLTINVLGGESVDTSTGNISVPEGGTDTFHVKLRVMPANTVTVNVARVSGDTDVSVNSGGVLYFTPANGTNWQTVVLAAAEDVDRTNGMATFDCSDPGGVFVSANVSAYEVDNDNSAPVFTIDPFSRPDATQSVAYAGSLSGSATDADGDPLTYSMISGPAWLGVTSGGGLSGIPSRLDIGNNRWTVRVADPNGSFGTAILNIAVVLNGSQIVLVGGNVRNGNFNNPNISAAFTNLADWFNLGTSGQAVTATKASTMYDATPYAEIGYLPGSKIFAIDTGHTLAEGDIFDVGYVWADGWKWNNTSHKVAVSLFVTSDNTTNGTQTVLVTDYSSFNETLNTYEAVNHDGFYTASAQHAGKRLFAKIDTTISSEAYAFLDNFELSLTPASIPAIMLTVISEHGSFSPSGVSYPVYDSVVNASMSGSPAGNSATQYVVTGWVGTGSATNGSGTNTSFAITNNTTIIWQWQTNYWVDIQAQGSGSLDEVSAWYGEGTNLIITATPDLYNQFDGWAGDTNNASFTGNQINFEVNEARSLAAAFSASRTIEGLVPFAWLAVWTNNFEAAVTNDSDGDGFTTAQEYWAGTDPTDRESLLRIDQMVMTSTNIRLVWAHARVDTNIPPVSIQRRASLIDGEWVDAGQKLPVDGTNIWENPLPDNGFFRLCVTNVPTLP